MAYFVAHMQKYSNNLGGLKSHNERDTNNHSNENIDVFKKSENMELVSSRDSSKSYEYDFKKLMKKKYTHKTKSGELRKLRDNQVKFNSFIFSASPEYFENKSKEQHIKYFEDCKKYLETKISSENIISAKIHFDEKTPHMHLVVVPITNDGRLSSKEIFNRQFLKEFQEVCPQFLKDKGHDIVRGENANGVNKRISELEYKKTELRSKRNEIQSELKNVEKEYTSNIYSMRERIKEKKVKFTLKKEYKISENELEELFKKADKFEVYSDENKRLKSELIDAQNSIDNLYKKLSTSEKTLYKHQLDSKKLEKYEILLNRHPEFKKVILEEKIILDYNSLPYAYSKEKFIKELIDKSKVQKLNKSEQFLVNRAKELEKGITR